MTNRESPGSKKGSLGRYYGGSIVGYRNGRHDGDHNHRGAPSRIFARRCLTGPPRRYGNFDASLPSRIPRSILGRETAF